MSDSIKSAKLKLTQNYECKTQIRNHSFSIDEPLEDGGKNLGPTPGEMLCASLAGCTAITLKMYIERKQWLVDSIEVEVYLKQKNIFERRILVKGDLQPKQRERIMNIANACPVHKLLEPGNTVETKILEN